MRHTAPDQLVLACQNEHLRQPSLLATRLLALPIPGRAVRQTAGTIAWVLLVSQPLALGVPTARAQRPRGPGCPALAPAGEHRATDLTGLAGIVGRFSRPLPSSGNGLAWHKGRHLGRSG